MIFVIFLLFWYTNHTIFYLNILNMSIIYFLDVYLYGNKDFYSLGSTASVTCFSNLTVLSLIWQRNGSSTNLMISTGINNTLQLQIKHLNITHNNSVYVCPVVIAFPFGRNITTSTYFRIIINDKFKQMSYGYFTAISRCFCR